jgi:hypothetical protein
MTKLRELAESFANKTPIGIYSPDDIIQIAYEAGFRAAIELAAQSLERDNDGRVVLWGTADAAKVIRALGGDDCDCNCHKAPPVGWEAGRCCPDCGASITGGRFD